ncbi:MAG TPA: threonine--tRNA ligase [Acidobacteriota bacterium]|nr:threonine--tRNA ligase [Acidobacteriota bacterium]
MQHQLEEHKQTPLYKMRHSLAHVLAQAVQKIRPGAKLGFGPPVDNGFYYDFILPEPISEEDFQTLEKEMRRIIQEKQEFQRQELPGEEAVQRLQDMGEPHKVEYAKELLEQKGFDRLSFYTNGPFVDMCEGPHLEHTGQIPPDAFKLASVAGAYWRGDERNTMMTRIYGWAFPSKKELKAYIAQRELALQRDHRKLGAQLDIYVIDDEIGKGLPLWLPNGAVLCHELEKLAMEMEFKDGYQRVLTPHITKGGLYQTSGHLTHYKVGMYPPMTLQEAGEEGEEVDQDYYLKPMNCPHHHKVFAARPRSYRDLPLRLAEYGMVYRYEKSGQLQGLTRVRGMHMNDAHIYCTRQQVKDEFKRVMRLHQKLYALFEFSDYYMRLSLRAPEDPRDKYVDDPEAWDYTEKMVREAMEELEVDYQVGLGEAAFYGPKVDIQFSTVSEREFTVSTNQLDFAIPPRFGLSYVGSDGQEHTPLCIHRAPLGTHERFVAFLIEHYGGAFPTWLAPVQVRVLPVSEHFLEYAEKLNERLREDLVRSEVDSSDEKLGKKIRLGATSKIPILLVVGEKEQVDGTVTVRRYGIRRQKTFKVAEFVDMVKDEIAQRRHLREW